MLRTHNRGDGNSSPVHRGSAVSARKVHTGRFAMKCGRAPHPFERIVVMSRALERSGFGENPRGWVSAKVFAPTSVWRMIFVPATRWADFGRFMYK